MRKNLFKTLVCVSVIASMLLPLEVSAIGTLEKPKSSDGDPWGVALEQYNDRHLAYVENSGDWGGHLIWPAISDRANYGCCLRVKKDSAQAENWVYVGKIDSNADLLTVGKEYTLSVDCLPGPFPYGRDESPNVDLRFNVGGVTLTFADMDHLYGTEWKTFSQDFTATKTYSPRLKVAKQGADIYLDNLVITEKETGNVVFYHNFDMLQIDYLADDYEGYMPDPPMYAETKAVPFNGIDGDANIGVIERDGGYAAYIRSIRNYDVAWRFSNMEAIVRALPAGTHCKVKYDYVYCDTADGGNYLADRMSWKESVTRSDYNWHTAEFTFDSKATIQCGFKIKPGCRMCVDNLIVTDLDGNVIAKEDFDTVPSWGGTKQFIAEPLELSQDGNEITVQAKVTNSYTTSKKAFLITAIYNNAGILEELGYIAPDIPSDLRGVNGTTTISTKVDVTGLTGKTFKAFLWDGLGTIKPLTGSEAKTIE